MTGYMMLVLPSAVMKTHVACDRLHVTGAVIWCNVNYVPEFYNFMLHNIIN
jgi:hypothetical protein